MKRLTAILVWSAISAAFIGPGTVTTASRAGAGHGLALLWAVLFSAVACLALQEASARLTVATGRPLGRVIREHFGTPRWLPGVVLGAVVLGCAAYQMGNLVGAVAGAGLRFGLPVPVMILGTGGMAAALLAAGSVRTVARWLGVVVAVMGLAFLVCAIRLNPAPGDVWRGLFVPSLPAGAGVLALGLVGTTVVPYNLFLGSGLARGRTLGEARLGLAVAVPLGGLVTAAILVVGTAVPGAFSFATLVEALKGQLGSGAGDLFAFGLFAAGLSSAVTAPLAAALTVRGFRGREADDPVWGDRGRGYRAVWGGTLLVGLFFALIAVEPVPAIILAQALNGVILPLVAVLLWLAVNDRRLVGERYLCGPVANAVLGASVLLTCILGSTGVARAGCAALRLAVPGEGWLLAAGSALAATLAWPVGRSLVGRRR